MRAGQDYTISRRRRALVAAKIDLARLRGSVHRYKGRAVAAGLHFFGDVAPGGYERVMLEIPRAVTAVRAAERALADAIAEAARLDAYRTAEIADGFDPEADRRDEAIECWGAMP